MMQGAGTAIRSNLGFSILPEDTLTHLKEVYSTSHRKVGICGTTVGRQGKLMMLIAKWGNKANDSSHTIISLSSQYIKYTVGKQANIKRKFAAMSSFLNIIGAIDCTHIAIKAVDGVLPTQALPPRPVFNLKNGEEMLCNDAHACARSVVERAIQLLKCRWQCLGTPCINRSSNMLPPNEFSLLLLRPPIICSF